MNMVDFQKISSLNSEDTNPQYYIQFTENANLKKAIDDIKGQYGLTDEDIDENTAIIGAFGSQQQRKCKKCLSIGRCLLLANTDFGDFDDFRLH